MAELVNRLRQEWKNSIWFRIWMIVSAAFVLLLVLLSGLWQFGLIDVGDMFIVDLKFYLEASQRFLARQEIYIAPRADFGLFAYSPFFAMLISPLTFLPYQVVWAGDLILHLAAYLFLYWRWFELAREYKLERVAETLIRLFPLWLVFTGFLNEIIAQNIYIFMALAGTLLLEAILKEKVGESILWLTVLLPIKPQWAFAAAIPLLLRRWRFALKILVGGLLAYLGTVLLTVAVAGPYALEQYAAYVEFLQSIPGTFFWNTLAVPGHIGYNNSIMQLVVFFTNQASYSMGLTLGIKILILLPLLGLLWCFARQPGAAITPAAQLEWAFMVYLGAFFYLDVTTELTLGLVILAYLLGTLPGRNLRMIAWISFMPYALSFLWATLVLPFAYALPLPEAVIDPALYLPVVLIAMLGFYTLLFWQLWRRSQVKV